jgi:hypothetical protein
MSQQIIIIIKENVKRCRQELLSCQGNRYRRKEDGQDHIPQSDVEWLSIRQRIDVPDLLQDLR